MAGERLSLLARTEFRRRVRAVRESGSQLAAYAIGAAFGSLFVLGLVAGAYFAGREVTAGNTTFALRGAATVFGALVSFSGFIVGLRVLQNGPLSPADEGVLLASSHRDVVGALLVLESTVPLGMLGIPGALAAVAFAVGAGSPAAVVTVLVGVVLACLLGTAGGFAAGMVVRNAIARSAFLARYKTAIGLLFMVAYFGVVFTDSGERVFQPMVAVLMRSPLQWVGDLALLGTVPTADPLRAGVVLLVLLVVLSAVVGVNFRLAALLWYVTPVEPTSRTGSVSMDRLAGLSRPTSHVVRKTWTRARRSPIRLIYVVYPVLFLVGPLATALRGEAIPWAMVPSVTLYGAWATGAAFTLNPIGDETPVLTVTLTTGISGRQFVGALWVAAAVVGVPLTLLVTLFVAAAAGYTTTEVALTGVLGVGLAVLGPGLAAGIGASFPRTTTATVVRNREAVVPSLFAFAIFSVVLVFLTLPIWIASPGPARTLLADTFGISTTTVSVTALVFLFGVAGTAALVSFRHACRRFDTYTVA